MLAHGEMINSSVIADWRAVSKKIHDIYMEHYLIGPYGHKYWVDEVHFRSKKVPQLFAEQ